ncbi:hypothetical protein [Rosenbergiella australiborealis]|uniref:Uncharacterized protein n=1 Tax=Rosenbergiella australiborealis TaxID=1544696 RepID=A0ABS5T7J3_9GAMM|nr:hypothetical protein [Rosenbergiella australiborealis]MBT0728321.1 hypothetical protein [Rosenbergiella australiborealis]
MTKIALESSFFEVDIVDIEIIELYSYRLYDEQNEEALQALSVTIVNNLLMKLLNATG